MTSRIVWESEAKFHHAVTGKAVDAHGRPILEGTTLGQVAYEHWCAEMSRAGVHYPDRWEDLPPFHQGAWQGVANAMLCFGGDP